MDMSLKAKLEAIIYAAETPVTLDHMIQLVKDSLVSEGAANNTEVQLRVRGALEELIRDYPLPVYAIGGMRAEDLEQAWRCGAHGLAMLRGAWAGEGLR